jgi:hypothetical protein
MSSGLYKSLIDEGLLVPHEEVDIEPAEPDKAYKIIRPELVEFISYPYEWCFSQLKDAALTTLLIQKKALESGMSLKDSSAYNIQFRKGKPVFIDTLSFEVYQEGRPWVAYRQFCQHFLAPLALMSYKDIRLNQLLRIYIDGIPLDLASALLPFLTRFNYALLLHLHLHAGSQRRYAEKQINTRRMKVSRLGLSGLIDSVRSAVKDLKWQPGGTEWAEYYGDTNYTAAAFEHKKQVVARFLAAVKPGKVWDLGANDGLFSRLAGAEGMQVISFDIDPAAVEKNYLECRKAGETNILPLVIDLTNPSPAIGWQNRERESFMERGPVDTVLALALVHHLAISNNVPLASLAEFFSGLSKSLIIEFIPKTDSQVQRLLVSREDIFPDYTQPAFEHEFGKYFTVENSIAINDSDRTLYLMRRR